MSVAGEELSLAGITLPDARSGQALDLGGHAATRLLLVIRHRH